MKIQEVIVKLLEPVTGIEETVDTLKTGDPTAEVKGIGVTFLATHNVIKKAVDAGINLLITHEPTFYNHMDETEHLLLNAVYQEKKRLIDESGLAIFRFHDYWHRYQPDGILQGVIQALGWEAYVGPNQSLSLIDKRTPLTIPETPLMDLVNDIKTKLNIPFVRVVGDLDMPCSRVGFLPGYGGTGAWAIPFYEDHHLDLIITGEGPEWETPEYVRDAIDQGKKKALMVLGHLKSEEAGMRYLANYMKGLFPAIPIEFIEEEQPFKVL